MESLNNYLTFRKRVDQRCREIQSANAHHINCRKGCSACCRHLNLFPVEAGILALALAGLPPALSSAIRNRAQAAAENSACPLLHEGLCSLYEARPVICRTHGLPILVNHDDRPRVQVCPENFKGVKTMSSQSLIDLETLNTTLTAINALFLKTVFPRADADWRPSIAQALTHGELIRWAESMTSGKGRP